MVQYFCRECGQQLRPGVRLAPGERIGGWQQQERRRHYVGDAAPVDTPFSEFHRETPARPPAVGGDVAVPALQAIISGVAIFLVGLAILWPDWQIAAAGGGIVGALAWFLLLSDSRRLLRVVEDVTGVDLDQDGHIGEPEPPALGVKLRIDEEEGRVTKYAHLPIDAQRLGQLARGLLGSESFAVASWTGRGKPFSRAEFETLRDWLFRNGYAGWEDPNNRQLGVKFTAKGDALLRALADVRTGVQA